MALDPNIMYKAGFGSTYRGVNPAADRRLKRQEAFRNFAYKIVGEAATGAIKAGWQSLQKFRNLADSQTSALNLKIDKLPKGNEHIEQSIRDMQARYVKANRVAHTSLSGKKRRRAKEERSNMMRSMAGLNAALEVYMQNTETSQGIAKLDGGVISDDNRGKVVGKNPGNIAQHNTNIYDQANGDMAKNLRWNIDENRMDIITGGQWQNGLYVDKNINDNTVLKAQWEAYKLDKEDYLGYENWISTNNKSTKTITSIPYSDMKFGDAADDKFEGDLLEYEQSIIQAAWHTNAVPWDKISSNKKAEFIKMINGYSDAQFKDFYFGGYSYDHGLNQMDASAPAYQRLMKDNPDITAYSNEWYSKLLVMKNESFVSGSDNRKMLTEKLWKDMENKYLETNNDFNVEQKRKEDEAYQKQLNLARQKQGLKGSGTYMINGQHIDKDPVDSVVKAFNNAKEDDIIPQGSVSWLNKNIQYGKDKKGWYVVNQKFVADPNSPQRRIPQGWQPPKYMSKDEVARELGINSKELGYNFSTSTVKTYTPTENINADQMVEKLRMAEELRSAYPNSPILFKKLSLKEIREEYEKYMKSIKDAVTPRP